MAVLLKKTNVHTIKIYLNYLPVNVLSLGPIHK